MSQETSCFTRFSENPEGIKNVFHAIFSTVYIYICNTSWRYHKVHGGRRGQTGEASQDGSFSSKQQVNWIIRIAGSTVHKDRFTQREIYSSGNNDLITELESYTQLQLVSLSRAFISNQICKFVWTTKLAWNQWSRLEDLESVKSPQTY